MCTCAVLAVKLTELKKQISPRLCFVVLVVMYREHKKKLVVTEKKLKALQKKQKVGLLNI